MLRILVSLLLFLVTCDLWAPIHDELIDSGYIPYKVYVTGYCPCRICCGRHADGKTAYGKKIKGVAFRRSGGTPHYGIAASPDRVPKDSQIIYPAYKPSRFYPAGYAWPVDDTGGAMRRASRKGYIHLDFRFIHHRSALRWAAKHGGWQTVYIRRP